MAVKKLFETKRDVVVIDGIDFNSISIKSKSDIMKYYNQNSYQMVTYNNSFSNLVCLDKAFKDSVLLWKIVADCLCIFFYDYKAKRMNLYTYPLSLDGNIIDKSAIKEVLELLMDINKNSKTYFEFVINDNCHINYAALKKLGGKRYSDNCDFIYRCDDLINLNGKNYKSNRNIVNNFKRNYPNHVIRFATKKDLPDIKALRLKWEMEYKKRDPKGEVWDNEILRNMFEYFEELPLKIMVAEVNDKLEGFFIIEKLCKNCSTVLKENTNIEIKGLSEYLWYESLRLNTDLGEFENDGNTGSKKTGLYSYKMSHHPIALIDRYSFNFPSDLRNNLDDILSKGVVK